MEQGGTGEGTVIRFQMRVFGQMRTFRAAITEPEPGRVLVETDLDTGTTTTFTVVPTEDRRTSRVIIITDMETHGGLFGCVERFLVTRLLRPVYQWEIERLEAVASERAKNEG